MIGSGPTRFVAQLAHSVGVDVALQPLLNHAGMQKYATPEAVDPERFHRRLPRALDHIPWPGELWTQHQWSFYLRSILAMPADFLKAYVQAHLRRLAATSLLVLRVDSLLPSTG